MYGPAVRYKRVSSSRRQSPARSSIIRIMRGDRRPGGEDDRQLRAREAQPLAHRNPALQQEGTNLVDDAGALADQPLAHPVQRLQVELVRSLGGDEFHRRALHRLGNRFGVAGIKRAS
jgi:hypothetical protein